MRKTESILTSLPPCVEVRASAIHGRGVFALRDLPKETCIGYYSGRRYTSAEVPEENWEQWQVGMTYLFVLSDGTTIDGAQGGNETRFVNHACEPNCVAIEEIADSGLILLSLMTSEDVTEAAELFLDYGLIIDETEGPSDYPCRCGKAGCRGSMIALAD